MLRLRWLLACLVRTVREWRVKPLTVKELAYAQGYLPRQHKLYRQGILTAKELAQIVRAGY